MSARAYAVAPRDQSNSGTDTHTRSAPPAPRHDDREKTPHDRPVASGIEATRPALAWCGNPHKFESVRLISTLSPRWLRVGAALFNRRLRIVDIELEIAACGIVGDLDNRLSAVERLDALDLGQLLGVGDREVT